MCGRNHGAIDSHRHPSGYSAPGTSITTIVWMPSSFSVCPYTLPACSPSVVDGKTASSDAWKRLFFVVPP